MASLQEWLDQIRSFEVNGEFFKAHDLARQGLEEHPANVELLRRAVLSLLNAGAISLGRQLFDAAELGARQETHLVTLGARLLKEEAQLARGPERQALLKEAALGYQKAYRQALDAGDPEAYYPGINVATLNLLSDQSQAALATAREVLALVEREIADPGKSSAADRYWPLATALEASFILDDFTRAKSLIEPLRAACAMRYDVFATTVRQLRLIAAKKHLELTALGDLSLPDVIHFTGHMIAPPGVTRGFQAGDETKVAEAISAELERRPVGIAYGALASGADILFAEALLSRGAKLNVVLPFPVEEFVERSVRPAGSSWESRFATCMEQAATVRFATEDSYLGDDQLYSYASQMAMGLAVLCARHLCAPVRQIAVWDGRPPQHAAGTAVDLAVWKANQLPQTILPCSEGRPASLEPAGPVRLSKGGRTSRAMLFGDLKGFSKLRDAQMPNFVAGVLGQLSTITDAYRDQIAYLNTWGDGIFMVLEDAGEAARCALQLQQAMAALDFESAGLPATLGLRVGGHFGPIYEVEDPLLKRTSYMGAHVSRAARIEPVTPEGCVYVTEPFAARLALFHADTYSCEYVGVTAMAKNYGQMRMFLLRQLETADGGPPTVRTLL